MIIITPSTATIARGGNTVQFTSSDPFVEWSVDGAGNVSGSGIDGSGLFTSGPNDGTAMVKAFRFDGACQIAEVTVT